MKENELKQPNEGVAASAARELLAALKSLVPHVLHYGSMQHAAAGAHQDTAAARAVIAKHEDAFGNLASDNIGQESTADAGKLSDVRKTVLQFTVLHDDDIDLASMSLEDIDRMCDVGGYIGGDQKVTSSRLLTKDELVDEAKALGADAAFFDEEDEGTPQLPNADDFPTIVVGKEYEFHAAMQEAELPADERMRNYTGQTVTVIAGPAPKDDSEDSNYFVVRAADGKVFTAAEEEVNGWDKALGQFFWPDGTYGPNKDRKFLANEKVAGSQG